MAAFTGRVWQLIINGTILGQECLNVFFYGAPGSNGDAIELADLFNVNVLGYLTSAVSQAYHVNSLDVTGVQIGGDLTVLTVNADGLVSGDCLPSFVAFAYTIVRSEIGNRNGYKRFAGVPESKQIDGVATSSWITTALIPLADALEVVLSGETTTYTPLVRSTVRNKVVLPSPEYFVYGPVAYKGIRSQVSRKVGHGH